ncbi:hypothetical protein K461DRAFT_295589 [Myriangium duriaei CBS 260.36]|uniref:Rhodopsin domain-containing protein n=1 Tax=Myriangium duriaei CBS 260.36 TaxID=1168546 RepID=A0A9P4IZ08_9PEZI|nr:hypothetical protein K461DRAFT_295589 [Myriangium duriaei CBS 260.36]
MTSEYMSTYNGDSLKEVSISFTVLNIVVFALRCLSKRLGRVTFGLDDLILGVGVIFSVAIDILGLVILEKGGIGHHLSVIFEEHPEKIVMWAKSLYALSIIYCIAVTLPKLAILVFYARIFVYNVQRMVTYVLMGFIISWSIAASLTAVFSCSPIKYFWDKSIVDGTCINIRHFWGYGCIPNIIADFVMLLLPLPMVWELQADIKVKAGLTVTLLTGSVGMVGGIIRTVEFIQHDPLIDGTWASSTLWAWTIIEPGFYNFAASFLCLRPLVKYLLGRTTGSEIRQNRSLSGSRPTIGYAVSRSRSHQLQTCSRETSISLIRRDDDFSNVPVPLQPMDALKRSRNTDEDEIFVGM